MDYKSTWLKNYYPAYGFVNDNGQIGYLKLNNTVLPSVYGQTTISTTMSDQRGGVKSYEIDGKDLDRAFKKLGDKMLKDFKGLGDEYHLSLMDGSKNYNLIYRKKNV